MTANAIFINYRRSLAFKDAKLLQRALQRSLGVKRVFLDTVGVEGGDHWLHTIERQVAASAAMVAIIGEGWVDALNEKGERRIDDPNDFVRFEIGRALARGIPVLPVLIDGANMPALAQLPQTLAPITFLQAMPLRMETFDDDAERIARRLRFLVAQARPRRALIWQLSAATALALVAGIIAGPLVWMKLGLLFVGKIPSTDNASTEFLSRLQIAEYERTFEAFRRNWRLIRTSAPALEKQSPDAVVELDRLTAQIYISNLSFLDVDSKSVMGAADAELIDMAVKDGMGRLSASDLKYAANSIGHNLPNNDANVAKLNLIYWDANMSRTDKVDKIVSELMIPSGIDSLVAGQFKQNPDGSVNVRPFVISKSTKSLVTESRIFKSEEYFCRDPSNPSKKVLCDKAVEDISETVIRLLKQL
jgi:hypothetical protein